MAENEDVNTLKRRGRRRLVGAIALVLAAVIVLPMVFDSEPRVGAPAVSVRIPGEEDASFRPKVTPKAPAEVKAPEKAPDKAVEKAAEKPAEKTAEKEPEKPAPKAAEKPAAPSAEAERARAERALAGGEQYVVQVGAFADPEKIKEVSGKLRSAKVPFYTEQVPVKSGMLTRVRAGPFTSRDAAEQSLRKLQDLGLRGSKIIGLS
jgi:DedD protein